ncbi:hypothetical protein GGX14DRAFT_560440 [Mycena pura]|uniref:Uncharacterized protein n=1 Tax=Mycena pura TaxID=153505 RepID=A0AAD6YIE4_9AGAR|nr:hypothetical protein GGX14DRAFT_560440 [Mycena pura]
MNPLHSAPTAHLLSARVCDPPFHRQSSWEVSSNGPPAAVGLLVIVYDGSRPGLYTRQAFQFCSSWTQADDTTSEVVQSVAAAHRAWHAECFLRHTEEFHQRHGLQCHERPMEDTVLYNAPILEGELDGSQSIIASTSIVRYVPCPATPAEGSTPAEDFDCDNLKYARGEAPHPDFVPPFRMPSPEHKEVDCTWPQPVTPVRCKGRTFIVPDWSLSRRMELLKLLEAPSSELDERD